jgi:hypothetical protein
MAQALRIERLLIDSGYLPGMCNAVAIKAGLAVLLCKGLGLRAGNKSQRRCKRCRCRNCGKSLTTWKHA